MKQNPLLIIGMGLLVPTVSASAAIIADSISDFSSNQGENNWYTGYRDYTADGSGDDYDPEKDFIPFTAAQWNPNSNFFKIGGNPPWTECGAEACHPNGANNTNEHWIIRRWKANVSGVTPLEITVEGRKGNSSCGDGVTVALYHNGKLQHSEIISYDNTSGVSFTYYINAVPGDSIDAVLTPVGDNGDRNDYCDGSYFSMIINDELPPNPQQPDGTPFTPDTGADTDGDGIPDIWELTYADNLTTFTSTSDYDGDGLLDKDEYARGSDPTKQDTDGDGLSDKVETKTSVYVSAEDTGTDPTLPDTDGDGLTDGEEVLGTPFSDPNLADSDNDGFPDPDERFFGSNPLSADDTPLSQALADSQTQFSGVQGQDGWEYGFRILSGPRPPLNYDPATDFIHFAGGSNVDAEWEPELESPQHWRGDGWFLQQNTRPWTMLTANSAHPNGINNLETHWSIRRWKASSLTEPTPVCIYWQTQKHAVAGGGVTAMIFVNGKIADLVVVPGSGIQMPVRKHLRVLHPNDVVDLVLTTTGPVDAYDWSDGCYQWMRIDRRLLNPPIASNGAFFAVPGAEDSDGDGLPDAWELYYTNPSSLATLSSATADPDNDGLTNAEEAALGTNPLLSDTDGDGLSDKVETNTGVFVSLSDTGTNPLLPDSDGDGLSDLAEVTAIQFKTDPYVGDTDNDGNTDGTEIRRAGNPTVAEAIQDIGGAFHPLDALASSVLDFFGSQGDLGWSYGYRDLSFGDGELNYDPEEYFIPFNGGDGQGDWDGWDQQWDGGSWRLSDNAPWTNIGRIYSHPNGTNSGAAHWTIRRWTASATLQEPQPLGLIWHVSKSNTSCGDGVTAALYINGIRQDEATIAHDDDIGVTHVFYAIIEPSDVIDLVLQHDGVIEDSNDWCDGSNTILRIIDEIPEPAIQPDGSIFGAAVTANFTITSVTRGQDGSITLVWPSESGKVYDVYASSNLTNSSWNRISPESGIAGNGANASFTDNTLATQPNNTTLFYRVSER